MNTIVLRILAAVVLSAIATDPALAQDPPQFIGLTPAEIEEFGIELDSAGPGRIVSTISPPAEIRPNADRLAHIVPRYSGIVTAVRVAIGDDVHKGETLATVESDVSLAPFEVVTLISGTVIEKHITLGEAVGRGGPAFVIADLSTVWVDITVYQRDLTRVAVGQDVVIYVGHEPAGEGTISYVTPVVSETTRTATARVVLDNLDHRWRPGMFVTAEIVVSDALVAVAVARTALHTVHDRTVVFVETPEGFTPRPVTLGRLDDHSAEVLDGLKAEERYVRDGGFTLKAELGKDSFGDGHAH
jgi:cobalt-zinc-cadmium efflux system membrane fusion protein